MSNIKYFSAIWFADFLGVGYILDDRGWSVFPIFPNISDAQKIWTEELESLDEKSLRMRFIEYGREYKFILYPSPLSKQGTNFCFYRSLALSHNYRMFKEKSKGKVLFRFGILEKKLEPIKDSKPIFFNKSKMVTDIKFMKSEDVTKNSIEWVAEEVQRRMREKYGYRKK